MTLLNGRMVCCTKRKRHSNLSNACASHVDVHYLNHIVYAGRIEVHSPQKLESDVLKKYFRHSKFASFQRYVSEILIDHVTNAM
jgi:HSF-type DNA-binding